MLTTTPFIFQDVVEGLEAPEGAINTDTPPDWKNEFVDNHNIALLGVWLCHHVRICQFLRTRRLLHICQHVRACQTLRICQPPLTNQISTTFRNSLGILTRLDKMLGSSNQTKNHATLTEHVLPRHTISSP